MRRFAAILALGALTLLAAPAQADTLPPLTASYSADWRAAYGEQTQTGRVYHLNGSEQQTIYRDGEETPVAILRADRERLYLMFHDREAYVALPVSSVQSAVFEYELYYFDAELIGRETMRGEEVSKYRVSGTDSAVGTVDLDVWVTDDGIYLRIEGAQTSGGKTRPVRIVKSNIRRGPQDTARFSPPAGYDELEARAETSRN